MQGRGCPAGGTRESSLVRKWSQVRLVKAEGREAAEATYKLPQAMEP